MKETTKYVAFLRGINVGGHHKLPMADLKAEIHSLGFTEIETLLNSGNLIFSSTEKEESSLEERIAEHLEKTFGFPVPVLVRKGEELLRLFSADPFEGIEVTPDIRLYISFLKQHPQQLELPWVSDDGSFRIIHMDDRTVCSVLDLSKSGSTKGMDSLEKIFGKNLTTRNWNTIEKMAERLKAGVAEE